MNKGKIIQRLNQLEVLGGLMVKEATMLKQELSGVVSDNSPRKGSTEKATIEVLSKRAKSRLKS